MGGQYHGLQVPLPVVLHGPSVPWLPLSLLYAPVLSNVGAHGTNATSIMYFPPNSARATKFPAPGAHFAGGLAFNPFF